MSCFQKIHSQSWSWLRHSATAMSDAVYVVAKILIYASMLDSLFFFSKARWKKKKKKKRLTQSEQVSDQALSLTVVPLETWRISNSSNRRQPSTCRAISRLVKLSPRWFWSVFHAICKLCCVCLLWRQLLIAINNNSRAVVLNGGTRVRFTCTKTH